MTEALYPLLLTPVLHVKVWGGRKLAQYFDKPLPDDQPYGEAWELHDTSTVENGALAGRTIADLIASHGADLIGRQHDPADGMPLLIKLLDANDWLSVQVHPDDQQARTLEGDPRGKTEAWIVLQADADARLVKGVRDGTQRASMAEAIRNQTFEDLIVYQTVQRGDVLYMPANTVHALGPGLVIYEVQQSSNVTYRLYDWGRVGLDGKPRQLHIEKGVQVANLQSLPPVTHPIGATQLVDGAYFQTHRHILHDATQTHPTADRFHALTVIDGAIDVIGAGERVTLPTGRTALIPAALTDYTLTGTGVVLQSHMTDGDNAR